MFQITLSLSPIGREKYLGSWVSTHIRAKLFVVFQVNHADSFRDVSAPSASPPIPAIYTGPP